MICSKDLVLLEIKEVFNSAKIELTFLSATSVRRVVFNINPANLIGPILALINIGVI